jgi:hypothetical protein
VGEVLLGHPRSFSQRGQLGAQGLTQPVQVFWLVGHGAVLPIKRLDLLLCNLE